MGTAHLLTMVGGGVPRVCVWRCVCVCVCVQGVSRGSVQRCAQGCVCLRWGRCVSKGYLSRNVCIVYGVCAGSGCVCRVGVCAERMCVWGCVQGVLPHTSQTHRQTHLPDPEADTHPRPRGRHPSQTQRQTPHPLDPEIFPSSPRGETNLTIRVHLPVDENDGQCYICIPIFLSANQR